MGSPFPGVKGLFTRGLDSTHLRCDKIKERILMKQTLLDDFLKSQALHVIEVLDFDNQIMFCRITTGGNVSSRMMNPREYANYKTLYDVKVVDRRNE
jgi:hypothetical protein